MIENLAAEGFGIMIRQQAPTFVRFTVQGAEGDTEVDLAVDARLVPSEPGELSRVLSSRELGVDKVLAVFGRAEPRHFVDLVAVEPLFGLKLLMQLAKVKDPGFDLTRFAEAWDASPSSPLKSSTLMTVTIGTFSSTSLPWRNW